MKNGLIRAALLLLAVWFVPAVTSAQGDNIIVKNAVLSDPDNPANDQVVTLVVRKGELDLITADPVKDKNIPLVVNADRGFILGKLNLNEPSGFMILSQDPRENPDVFLDTKAFTTFAMKEGRIVRNNLLAASDEQDLAVQSGQEWFAYSAPRWRCPLHTKTGISGTGSGANTSMPR
jgi:hypothetical protein